MPPGCTAEQAPPLALRLKRRFSQMRDSLVIPAKAGIQNKTVSAEGGFMLCGHSVESEGTVL